MTACCSTDPLTALSHRLTILTRPFFVSAYEHQPDMTPEHNTNMFCTLHSPTLHLQDVVTILSVIHAPCAFHGCWIRAASVSVGFPFHPQHARRPCDPSVRAYSTYYMHHQGEFFDDDQGYGIAARSCNFCDRRGTTPPDRELGQSAPY